MWKLGKDYVKNANKKLDNLSREDLAAGAKEIAGAAVGEGLEVAKTGIFGIANGLFMKAFMFIASIILLIVITTSAGCIGVNVVSDALTDDKQTKTERSLNKL